MRTIGMISAAALVFLGSMGQAQNIEQATWGRRNCTPYCPPVCPPVQPDGTRPPTEPPPVQPPMTDAFAQAGEGGTAPAASFQPGFFGDLVGYSGARIFRNPNQSTQLVRVPFAARAGVKITDGESPRPMNRIFFNYNYYSNVNEGLNPGISTIGLSRYMFGFEKTFLGGDASFGMRMPFVTLTGFQGVDGSFAGDLSMIAKYALINDWTTGNVLSGGLMITVPTGQAMVVDVPGANVPGTVFGGPTFIQEKFNPVVLQPYLGIIYNFTDRLYLHGFSAIAVPTDSRDVTLFWNDVGLGYWLYRNQADRFVQGVVPTFEWHVNTPLNHRGANESITFPDEVDMTGGCYFVLPRSTLGVAAGFPVTGPRPFGVEGIVSFNFRW